MDDPNDFIEIVTRSNSIFQLEGIVNLEEIKQKLSTPQKKNHVRDAAVLLPLVSIKDELHILFQVRALTLHAQPGETCFPGGRIDRDDQDAQAAALREFHEEFGIKQEKVTILSSLNKIESPRRGLIHPFVAHIDSLDEIKPNTAEVEDWFTVPVAVLLSTPPEIGYVDVIIKPGKDFPIDRIANAVAYQDKRYSTPESFYVYKEHIIWGLTARILQEFLEHIKS
nr:CoA pyrophosphatase [Alkalicoccobacillus plakortidis]